MSFILRKRRRAITILSTESLTETIASQPPQEITIVRQQGHWRRKPAPQAIVLSARSSPPAAGIELPHVIVVARLARQPSLPPQPILLTPTHDPGTIVPTPHMAEIRPLILRRLLRTPPALPTKAIVLRTAMPIPPNPHPLVVGRPVGIPGKRPRIISEARAAFPPINTAKPLFVVVPRPAWLKIQRPIIARSEIQNIPSVLGYQKPPIIVSRLLGRAAGKLVSTRTSKPIILLPVPIVVQPRRQIWLPPSIIRASGLTGHTSQQNQIRPTQSIFVQVPRVSRAASQAIISLIGTTYRTSPYQKPKIIQSFRTPGSAGTPIRLPIITATSGWFKSIGQPQPILSKIFQIPYFASRQSIITSMSNPTTGPPDPVGTGPPDLIAACIAMLKLQPSIVSALGESSTTEKIFSDIGERDTSLPYICFSEPQEIEGYETRGSFDAPGTYESLAVGIFILEVYNTTKIGARQLAEQLVNFINDAPLVFEDGVLVYLRRTMRQYPTLKTLAPGTNVVQYKRVLEFAYQIERSNIP